MSEFLQSVPLLGVAVGYVLPFLLLLTLVVAVHEFGHYLVARWCGVRSAVFSVGFGRELVGWTDRLGTRWRFSIVPLGGYVRFHGDLDAASATSESREAGIPGSFADAPLWRRAAIVFAGPAANFLFCAAILFAVALVKGEPVSEPVVGEIEDRRGVESLGLRRGDRIIEVNGVPVRYFGETRAAIRAGEGEPIEFLVERGGREMLTGGVLVREPRIATVVPGSAADAAGFRGGDRVLRIDGREVNGFRDIQRAVLDYSGTPLEFAVLRDGTVERLVASPRWRLQTDPDSGLERRVPILGVSGASELPFRPGQQRVGPVEALGFGVGQTVSVITLSLGAVGDLVTGRASLDDLGGPVAIANFSGQAAQRGLEDFLLLLALISASIGLVNLFPIPVLDGGHLILFALEAIRGRPLGERASQNLFRFGFVFIIGLMVLITFNDLANL